MGRQGKAVKTFTFGQCKTKCYEQIQVILQRTEVESQATTLSKLLNCSNVCLKLEKNVVAVYLKHLEIDLHHT